MSKSGALITHYYPFSSSCGIKLANRPERLSASQVASCYIKDRGLFHSTRPSDILKFLVSTLLPGAEVNTYVLLACLFLGCA